ncbi:17912_t:CDS:2 [Cetraspora pellucida]|uniref:17912_t:CDS:1 n=1 Tax=Cetraspora pellucida TaxID=1433469 RepID=A0ACA9JYT0_9GLOM|nr:17912_t:CDS:2 [Cetraspora pellucida]
MGQAQDKFVDEQNEDGSQDSPTVEDSVITEATFTVVASESQVHHDISFSPPSTQNTQLKRTSPNSVFGDIEPNGIRSEKGKFFASDVNGHIDLAENDDNFTIHLTSSTIDFSNNSLASSLANLTIRDSPSLDSITTASVVQATKVKNTHNSLSRTIENYSPAVEEKSGSIKIAGTAESTRKRTSKDIKSTLADEAEYTIPPAIAEDVLREMLANKPSQDLLEELEPPTVVTNGKGENSSSKFKGDSVNHEKNGESSEPSKSSNKKNNLLILSGMIDSPFPSKFTFPNIADKNFFLPNFSNSPATSSLPSFSFGNPSELSLQNPFQNPSISSNAPANISHQKEQRRVTLQWHPPVLPVLDKFSPQLSSKTPSISMPSSSIWPPSINTTSPTDTHFSNSNLLFPQFTGSFKFDMNSKNAISGPQSSSMPPPLVHPSTPPLSPSTKKSTVSPPASSSRKGLHSNERNGRTTTLYVSAKTQTKSVDSNNNVNGNIQTPLLVSSTPKKMPMKFGDVSNTLTSTSSTTKGITNSINSNNTANPSTTLQTSPPRGFAHNATNTFPFFRPIRKLPSRAKSRLAPNGPLPVIPPSPLFSFATPTNSEEEDFDAEEEDGSNDNGHTDWLDNANNKKKRKALQTVGGGSVMNSSVGGVMKTSTAKERANPLRRVERRSTQRNINLMNKTSLSSDIVSSFDHKISDKDIDSVRPPQTTFDFSFKSIPEKSAALAAASVNASSAKRLAAVSPIQTMNTKNDPFTSSLFLQQSPTVTTISVSGGSKKKASTKRAAPSSVAFKNDEDDASSTSGSVDIQSVNNNAPRRRIKFPEKNGDWICMFCEYRLYYGDERRARRRPKVNTVSANGGYGGNNNAGEGGNGPDKALAT